MSLSHSSVTVLFDDPFWIALFEREYDEKYEVCKIIFGAEPKDYEVYSFLLKNYKNLVFSLQTEIKTQEKSASNPKRLQRVIRKNETRGISTKAQRALSLMREQNKTERKKRSKEIRELEAERRFEQKKLKHKEKHRGH